MDLGHKYRNIQEILSWYFFEWFHTEVIYWRVYLFKSVLVIEGKFDEKTLEESSRMFYLVLSFDRGLGVILNKDLWKCSGTIVLKLSDTFCNYL